MARRVDSASRIIHASRAQLYRAFYEEGALEAWLPPDDMTGKILHSDFREGGSYRMRLRYKAAQPGQGKTSDDSDEVEVRLTKLVADCRIEQEVRFYSADSAFSGAMRMTWTFEDNKKGTLVRVSAENVPAGIRPEEHEAGLHASLKNLAEFVENRRLTRSGDA